MISSLNMFIDWVYLCIPPKQTKSKKRFIFAHCHLVRESLIILHDFHDCIVRTTDIPWNYPPHPGCNHHHRDYSIFSRESLQTFVTELGVDRRYTQFIDVRRGTNTERRVVVRESADLIQRWMKQSWDYQHPRWALQATPTSSTISHVPCWLERGETCQLKHAHLWAWLHFQCPKWHTRFNQLNDLYQACSWYGWLQLF